MFTEERIEQLEKGIEKYKDKCRHLKIENAVLKETLKNFTNGRFDKFDRENKKLCVDIQHYQDEINTLQCTIKRMSEAHSRDILRYQQSLKDYPVYTAKLQDKINDLELQIICLQKIIDNKQKGVI